MNTTKFLIATGLVAVSVAAQAQINLTGAGSFSLGGNFAGTGATPVYTPGSSVSAITVSPTAAGHGSLNQWWFSVASSSNISTVTYSVTLSGINANSAVSGLITAWNYNSTTGVVGPTNYLASPIFITSIDAYTGSTASTQTLNFVENISTVTSETAFFEGNLQFRNIGPVPEPSGIAAMSLGALGLLIRRRRRSI